MLCAINFLAPFKISNSCPSTSIFKKPISCHLYPIRTKPVGGFEILNYHNWQICSPALKNGNSKKTPMYKFLESALIRKFGKQWYYDLVDKAKKINVNK